MIAKHEGLEIPIENPFLNDKFQRENIADNLTKIIDASEGSLILSVDAGWGKGKTTFIEMWKKKLDKTSNYKTVYFNAWENDDINDPLLALIGEIEFSLNDEEQKPSLDNIKSTGKSLLKKVIPSLLKMATNGVLDVNNINLGDFNEKEIVDLTGKLGEIELASYKKEKEAKFNFKNALQDYQKVVGKKIIIFIDELDRCRPTFAIETLERVKHLFYIKDYMFVLALDKKQLNYSIQTMYGQNMDSQGYLKRFIDLEYVLPEPDTAIFSKFLIDKYKFKNRNTRYFEKYLDETIKYFDLSLRDIEKLFFLLQIVLPLTELSDLTVNYRQSYLRLLGVIYSLFPVLKIKEPERYIQFLRAEVLNESFYEVEDRDQALLANDADFSTIMKNIVGLRNTVKSDDLVNIRSFVIGQSSIGEDFNLSYLLDKSGKNFIFVNKIDFIDQFNTL